MATEAELNLTKCARCGVSEVFDGVGLWGDAHVKLCCHADPGALLMKETAYSALAATVCGNCGAVEFTASEPAALKAAWRKGQARKFPARQSPR